MIKMIIELHGFQPRIVISQLIVMSDFDESSEQDPMPSTTALVEV